MTGDAQRTISSVADCASVGSSTSSWYWSGLSQNARMPCEIELRVVSLPATAISRKKRLKSISDERVAVDLGVEQRGDDVVARLGAPFGRERVGVHEHLDLRVLTSSSETMYSGSSLPIIRLLHSKSLCRSSCGTPSISAITWSGSSAATSTTKSHPPCSITSSRICGGLLADVGSSAPSGGA